MDILSRVEGFEWDEGNIKKSWERHRVSYIECEEVFFNRPLVVQENEAHSKEEERYYVLGKTNDGRYLFVVFTIRHNKIRVIAARDMSRKERRMYHAQVEEGSKIQE
jgi:uncharacterized DUF497 family protein